MVLCSPQVIPIETDSYSSDLAFNGNQKKKPGQWTV